MRRSDKDEDMRRAAAPNALDKPGFLASLVYPDYCLLWGATACGQAAAWALVVLRAALVYELTRSNATAMLAVAAVGASTSAFMTLCHGAVQTLAPDGLRWRGLTRSTGCSWMHPG